MRCYLSDRTVAMPTQLLHMHAVWEQFKGGVYFIQFEGENWCGTIQGWKELKEIWQFAYIASTL